MRLGSRMKTYASALVIGCLLPSGVAAEVDPGMHSHDRPASGSVLLEPFEHLHRSELGTPLVHSFGVEPAFTERDLFTDYRYRSSDGITEHEIGFELEWAFTRRLGIIVEAPYLFESADGGADSSGFGDLAIVPRALVLERERLLLTTQVEVVAPTGTNGFGGDTAIAPGVAFWLDLGDWWTLNSQLAIEHSFSEDASEAVFGFGLVKSWSSSAHASPDSHGHAGAAGLFNLHLEVTGSVGLGGEDEGVADVEGLVGFSYGLIPGMDIRIGYEFPLSSPDDFNGGLVTGVIWHF